ncbi:flagellar hook-associated protein 2 [Salirhabdus euzebyi]|uniref:Flagellar hook-associated protein 2 n=1 Tax=Salirhabdus euzebyi TaxID=394506 RepID=A0A841Q584_9BACI|nr:flagellar filament capping protein FliD [Salirhabdus euzebyi]MBB6453619.1 flagellar hook-associated protein 2 [Salirhabdus euzebyi]
MSSMRIGGLASGMDIDQLVNDLMKAERMPLQKLQQDQMWLTWQRDAYREANALLFDLDSLAFNSTLTETFKTKSVSSSNEGLVSISAGASAANGVHTIENATVASAASNVSGTISGATKIDPTKSLFEQRALFGNTAFANEETGGIWEKKTFTNADIAVTQEKDTFKLQKGALNVTAGETIEVHDSDGNLLKAYTIVTDPNQTLTENDVYVNANTGDLKFGENLAEGSSIKGKLYEHYYLSFGITTYDSNGNPIEDDPDNPNSRFDFEIDGTTTLNNLMSQISNSKVGVSAFYDTFSDKLSFQRKQTGDLNTSGKEMQFSGSFLTDVLNLDEANETGGTNATFTIDGLTTSRASNTFTISGVTYTLKGNIPAGTKVSVSVQNDTEKAVENIKDFVKKYNELIDKMNGMLREERYRSYKPLTEDQKKDMSDNEIELWEERAKSGLLRNDSILSSAISGMRSAFYSVIETNDDFKHLSEIGITTTSNYLEGGKLQINESKLRQAMSDSPDAVQKLFSNSATGDSRGILNRVRDSIKDTMGRIEEKAGKSTHTLQQYSMGRRLDDMNDRITRFEDRMIQVEDRYWRQFTAMEQAINRMNSQSMYLSQQFSGGM